MVYPSFTNIILIPSLPHLTLGSLSCQSWPASLRWGAGHASYKFGDLLIRNSAKLLSVVMAYCTGHNRVVQE